MYVNHYQGRGRILLFLRQLFLVYVQIPWLLCRRPKQSWGIQVHDGLLAHIGRQAGLCGHL